MARYDALTALPNGEPGPWGDPVAIKYNKRDVLLYAVGIGIRELGFVYEGHPKFGVFPTFPIRWGGAGAPIDRSAIPSSPGPLNIDAERYLQMIKPLPVEGEVTVRSRLIGVHPRGKGNGFVECESTVADASGEVCIKMVNGSFRRGVKELGDILLFALCGNDLNRFKKIKVRFSSPVFLNDTLKILAWHDGPGRALFEARVGERVVVSNA
ncbi:MAG: hypothetical protein AAEJ52_09135, partial [Myxococcota bacterium]